MKCAEGGLSTSAGFVHKAKYTHIDMIVNYIHKASSNLHNFDSLCYLLTSLVLGHIYTLNCSEHLFYKVYRILVLLLSYMKYWSDLIFI